MTTREPTTPGVAWRRLRALRASPLGLAGSDEERRGVFSAALGQAEEMAAAAQQVGPESKPILLFFALEQGGRALTADLAESDWKTFDHGLRVPRAAAVPETEVQSKDHGAFPVAARSVGSPLLPRPARISELCASLPELPRSPGLTGNERRCGAFGPDARMIGAHPAAWHVHADTAAVFRGPTDDELREMLDTFPGAAGYQVVHDRGTSSVSPGRYVVWPDASAPGGRKRLSEIAAPWGKGRYHLRPPVGGGHLPPPSLLMTWWALLYGLAHLARYSPHAWMNALDPDRSLLATELEEILEIADWRLPQLLEDAFHSRRRAALRSALAEADGDPSLLENGPEETRGGRQ